MMVAYIHAAYQPTIDFIRAEMYRATIDRDAVAVRHWERELERAENAKAAEIDAENARHEAAIAACSSQ